MPLSPLCTDLSSCHEEATGEFNIEDKSINETTRHDIVVKAASFILNLKEKFKLTQVSIDFVTHSVEELLKASTENIKQGILEYLHQQGIEIALPFPDKCFPVNLFQRFTTEYQQTKFYKEYFGLIVSFIQP